MKLIKPTEALYKYKGSHSDTIRKHDSWMHKDGNTVLIIPYLLILISLSQHSLVLRPRLVGK